MKLSVIIRTLNEARYLGELVEGIRQQKTRHDVEIVIVDSGSTDRTLDIAKAAEARIVHIDKQEFSFGRSLNFGCEASEGEILVFVSGHCVPVDPTWLENLVSPLVDGEVGYVYGRQIGRDTTEFSESRVFEKYFPSRSAIPQSGFFCNNANAATTRNLWARFRFNEELTGLEDMYLAKQAVVAGLKIGYAADAVVFHIHNESWQRIRTRYERESIALREIMPEVHISLFDLVGWVAASVWADTKSALAQGQGRLFLRICLYRVNQYWGSYLGNHEHKKVSRARKQRYFYPQADGIGDRA